MKSIWNAERPWTEQVEENRRTRTSVQAARAVSVNAPLAVRV